MSGVERERKFLVHRIPAGLDRDAASEIVQGYLVIAPDGSEVRVRRRAGSTVLTVKQGSGLERREEEIGISQADFDRLWPLTEGSRIEKRRYELSLDGGLVLELDVYEGALRGLAVAEVEFPSAAAARKFIAPDWLGAEVTEDDAYKNRMLATAGLPAGHPSGAG